MSKGEDSDFHGLEIGLQRLDGARAFRIVHPPGQRIAGHSHDWACLTLHVIGGYTETYDGGDIAIAGPAAVLHAPGRAHANAIDNSGLETVSIQFDLAWLRLAGIDVRLDRSYTWNGGTMAAAAKRVAALWADRQASEQDLAAALGRFIARGLDHETSEPAPAWLHVVHEALRGEEPPTTIELARALQLHPAWLSRAYRAACGEGIQDAVRRKRVEKAALLLRTSSLPPCEIALESGFCDQSHMNRSLRTVIGRTPLQVRAETDRLGIAAGAMAERVGFEPTVGVNPRRFSRPLP